MWLIAACSTIFITIFCLANRSFVEINIWPTPIKQHVQLFVLLLACLGIGILWGGFATWFTAGTSRKKAKETKSVAIAAELDAFKTKERCSRLEQDLQDLRTQEKSSQNQIDASPPLKLSSSKDTT